MLKIHFITLQSLIKVNLESVLCSSYQFLNLNKTILDHSLLLDITIDVSKTHLLIDFGYYRFLCNINVEIVA